MNDEFKGFPKEIIDFFWELRMNNNTEWFRENKDRYDTLVKTPMKLFSDEMEERLNNMKLGESFVPAISRANRDIRFAKDKSPYKDRKWVVFNYREGRWRGKICFYFEVAPEGWCCGVGSYESDSAFLTRYRNKLAADNAAVERLEKKLAGQSFFKADTRLYKKNFIPEGTPKNIEKWFQFRNVAFASDYRMDEELFTKDILDVVEEKFKFLKPYFLYLKDI